MNTISFFLDKHQRGHSGHKQGKHRDYRQERIKDKPSSSSFRSHKERSKESSRSIPHRDEKRKGGREEFPPSSSLSSSSLLRLPVRDDR